MNPKAFVLLGVCFLLTLPMAAQSAVAVEADQNLVAAVRADGATLAGESEAAPRDLGLFAPKPEVRTCYSQCLRTEIPIYCAGLSGAILQQCTNDIAEGCRCSCGLYCP